MNGHLKYIAYYLALITRIKATNRVGLVQVLCSEAPFVNTPFVLRDFTSQR